MNFVRKRFAGRADRRSFALPVSFIVLFPYIYNLIAGIIIVSGGLFEIIFGQLFVIGYAIFAWPWFFPLLSLTYIFVLPITVRRLHDIDWSAWFIFSFSPRYINCGGYN